MRKYVFIGGTTDFADFGEALFAHLSANHLLKALSFTCINCSFRLKANFSWKMVQGHVHAHYSDLRVCDVCSYYDNERSELSAHVERLHAFKDVPILTHHRSMQLSYSSISLLFALVRKCFSTLSHCLFCRKPKIHMDTYVHHLKTVQGPTLRYYCEICNTVLPFL